MASVTDGSSSPTYRDAEAWGWAACAPVGVGPAVSGSSEVASVETLVLIAAASPPFSVVLVRSVASWSTAEVAEGADILNEYSCRVRPRLGS